MLRLANRLAVCLLVMATSAFAAERPKVVVILVDDMGWSDNHHEEHS